MKTKQVVAVLATVGVIAVATVAATIVTRDASDRQLSATPPGSADKAPRRFVPPGDTDGDGRTDLIVYRVNAATFWVDQSAEADLVVTLGGPGDLPVTGDFDGDGRADLVAVRPGVGSESGTWLIRSSRDGSTRPVSFGLADDVAVPGDYDGDGRDDVAVFRPAPPADAASTVPDADDGAEAANAQWFVRRSSDDSLMVVRFGVAGDVPITGDYDGDGTSDLAVQRVDTRWIKQSSDGATVTRLLGRAGDLPVAVDRDGDRRTDLAVVRREGDNLIWYTKDPTGEGLATIVFGRAVEPFQQRIVGDFDGDGRTEPGAFDPAARLFWIWSPDGTRAVPWGAFGDLVATLGVDPVAVLPDGAA